MLSVGPAGSAPRETECDSRQTPRSQAWRTPYPAKRGRRGLGSRPYVHCGFLRNWTAAGFSQRLVARVRDTVAAMPLKGRRARIYVTGGRLHAPWAWFEVSAFLPYAPGWLRELRCG